MEQPYAELRIKVIDGWEGLRRYVAEDSPLLESLAADTGVPFRRLDFARRVRNECAHGKNPDYDRLEAALDIIEQAQFKLDLLDGEIYDENDDFSWMKAGL